MNLNCAFLKFLTPPPPTFNRQVVRWRRPSKPFWIGVAKSKKFRVPQPVIRIPEEKKQNRFLRNTYNTQLKSLLNFIRVENPNLNETVDRRGGYEMKASLALREKISKSWEINDSWNAETAKLRENRMRESEEEQFEFVVGEVTEKSQEKKKRMEAIEEIVRKEKTLAKSYITPENLDKVIEDCLSKVECFDYAIDLDGNRYPGRDPLPSTVRLETDKKETEESVA